MNKLLFFCGILLLLLSVGVSADNWCYQESANVSNQTGIDGSCGLKYTGAYSFAATWLYPENAVDGDWSTYSSSSTGPSTFMYANYSKPTKANAAINRWAAPLAYPDQNASIPSSCFNFDNTILQLRFWVRNVNSVNYSCWNGTWVTIASHSQPTFGEEGMYWNITPNNVPIVTSVNISPIYGVDTQINYTCTDADSSDTCNSFVQYKWYKNGVDLGISSSILGSGNYTYLDSLIASVRVTDGYNYSSWVNSSASIVIDTINQPPVIRSARISPINGYASTTWQLYCNASDANLNTSLNSIWYNYKIFRNGVVNISQNSTNFSQSVESNIANISGFQHFDVLILSCQANDSFNISSWMNSTPVILDNLVPIVNSINISPSTITYLNDTTIQYNCSDGDLQDVCNTSVEYKWFKNGNDTFITTQLLNHSNFTIGDTLIASVRVSDLYNWSTWVNSSPIAVQNLNAPIINSYSVSSYTPSIIDTILLSINCTDISGINTSWAYIIDPNGLIVNYDMTNTTTALDNWQKSYVPSIIGDYFIKLYCKSNTNTTAFTPLFTVTTSAPVTPPAGGGGGGTIYIGNLSVYRTRPGSQIVYVSPGSSYTQELAVDNLGSETLLLKATLLGSNATVDSMTLFESDGKNMDISLEKVGGLVSNTRYIRYVVTVPKETPFGDYMGSIHFTSLDKVTYDYNFTIAVSPSGSAQLINFFSLPVTLYQTNECKQYNVVNQCLVYGDYTVPMWSIISIVVAIIGIVLYLVNRK